MSRSKIVFCNALVKKSRHEKQLIYISFSESRHQEAFSRKSLSDIQHECIEQMPSPIEELTIANSFYVSYL